LLRTLHPPARPDRTAADLQRDMINPTMNQPWNSTTSQSERSSDDRKATLLRKPEAITLRIASGQRHLFMADVRRLSHN
ncbi:hypothetical protein, partial [Streptomyces sp. NPDC006341]|uniref:hypothetical protein n=1 Tax=Streptomyces sp. NPDC006341 TaxID=3156756 RepID=UPI0033AE099A